jgi:hypothetical protein
MRIKRRSGPLPDLLRKGHTHEHVERRPTRTAEIADGISEYEEQKMGKILPVGGHVEVLKSEHPETWVPAEVIDLLAAQFTAEVDGHTRFFLYADRNVTWRQLREK